MAVHVVRDNGGDWRTALASSFLAPLLTGLVNNHFQGLQNAKENAFLGELANAAGNMPNTTPGQGNGFAGQFTPPGMMQSGQGGGLNQLFSVLGNPRFKSVNAARAMELAKPWLTEQFYNGFNPADSAQMMRGMGMGYVPKEAASYYSDMYKYQNPHQQFQNMNLGDRMVYGGFNPANGQFTQGGEMAVGMDPFNAGRLANERQRMANDYALGIRRDDTDRYRIDTQDSQFGAELGYKNRQQDWFENPENPRNKTEKKLYTDAEGKVVRIDPYAEAGDTGVKAAPQAQQVNDGDVKRMYSKKADEARKAAADIFGNKDIGGLNDLRNQLADLDPNSSEAAQILKNIRELEAQAYKYEDEANIFTNLSIDPDATQFRNSRTGGYEPIPQQYRIHANTRGYQNAGAMSAQPQGVQNGGMGAALEAVGEEPEFTPPSDSEKAEGFSGRNRRGQRLLPYETMKYWYDNFNRSQKKLSKPNARWTDYRDELEKDGIVVDPRTMPKGGGTGLGGAMEAVSGDIAPKQDAAPKPTPTPTPAPTSTPTQTQRTQSVRTNVKEKAPWSEIQMRNWDRLPWLAPNAYKEWKARNGGK